jgi:hypothetical protein
MLCYLLLSTSFNQQNPVPMNTRIAIALLLIGCAFITSGWLFKFLHWPSANIQLLIGALILVVALITLAANVLRSGSLRQVLEQ